MSKEQLYHNPAVPGFWTEQGVFDRDIVLNNGEVLTGVIPIGVAEEKGSLVLVLSTFEGRITQPVDDFLGLRVVRGNSQDHPFESDDELLVEFTYFKVDKMEGRPRRIRPTTIMFGIHGASDENSGSHRSMGESADFYLEGEDTQYDPRTDSCGSLRRFPFWRMGVWGNPAELAKEYLPEPPKAE